MENAEASYPPTAGPEVPVRVREWTDDDVERAADLILESRRAVLYVGGGVITANASDELRELADLTHIPLTTTLMGLGAFPSRHPLSLGMLGMHGAYATNMAVTQCDLLIAVGARFDDRPTLRRFIWTWTRPRSTRTCAPIWLWWATPRKPCAPSLPP